MIMMGIIIAIDNCGSSGTSQSVFVKISVFGGGVCSNIPTGKTRVACQPANERNFHIFYQASVQKHLPTWLKPIWFPKWFYNNIIVHRPQEFIVLVMFRALVPYPDVVEIMGFYNM